MNREEFLEKLIELGYVSYSYMSCGSMYYYHQYEGIGISYIIRKGILRQEVYWYEDNVDRTDIVKLYVNGGIPLECNFYECFSILVKNGYGNENFNKYLRQIKLERVLNEI